MTFRRILILDTESTGLDPKQDQVIEVAAIVYDLAHRTPVDSFASLMFSNSNAAEQFNHIPAALLLEAPPPEIVWLQILKMAKRSDVIVAHRVEFDKSFSPPDLQAIKPWCCSKFDIAWPGEKRLGEHLVHLALAHKVGVLDAHRAMTDCDILARLFTRAAEMGADLQTMLRRGLRPKNLFYSLAPFEEKDVVKEHGFAWDPSKHGKNWYRSMPAEDVPLLPFKVRQID
jgi:DNA polymerase-3 subunit epsilon